MALPARKDEVYDEQQQPDSLIENARPKFEVHQGGGETTDRKTDHLSPVEDDENTPTDNPIDDQSKNVNNESKLSEGDDKLPIAQAEKQEAKGLGLEASSLYTGGSIQGAVALSALKKNKKKYGVAGVILGLVVAGFLFMFVTLAPLKILHLTQNLQDRFFATAEDAMDEEVDRLMTGYIRGKMLAFKSGNCKGTKIIDHTCNPYSARDSLVKKLYYGWNDKKLEEKLRKNHGIAFAVSDSNTYYVMRFFDKNDERIASIGLMDLLDQNSAATIGEIIEKDGSVDTVTRKELKAVFKNAMKDESLYTRSMYRIKVGKYLERKFGIKRCITGCIISDWKNDKKRAVKMFAAQRVLAPRAETFTYLYTCVLSNECNPKTFSEVSPDSYNAGPGGCNGGCIDGGEPKSDFDKKNRAMLATRLVSRYDGDVDKLRADYDRVARLGILASIGRFNSKVEDDGSAKSKSHVGEDLAKQIAIRGGSKAIPIIGQIDMAATIVGSVDTLKVAGPAMIAIMNSTSASQYFTMYRTVGDEIKEGDVDNEVIGSFVDGLGPGVQIDSTEEQQKEFGGTAGAEQSPLYSVINGTSDERASFANYGGLLGKTARAASSTYQCKDGSYPDLEKPICNEQKVMQEGNAALDGFNKVTNSPAWNTVSEASRIWNKGRNFIIDTAGKFLGKTFCNAVTQYITGCFLLDDLADAAKKIVDGLASWLNDQLRDAIIFVFTNIFGLGIDIVTNHMSGAWAYNATAAGADVSGNSFSHHGLGGRVLTSQEVASIVNEQEDQRYFAYQSKPFFSRIIDTESKYSPASKLALKMPSNKNELTKTNFASLITSTFKSLLGSLGSLFSDKTNAQKVMDDPFGVQQYGFTDDDPTLKEDPDTFWTKNCVTTFDGGNDISKWSLSKLYNLYGSYTATANVSGAYSPVNDINKSRDFKDPLKNAIAKEFFRRSPNGTNRCMLIQSAVGSAGAIFTDDVLSEEEKSVDTAPAPSANNGGGGISCSGGIADQSAGVPPAQYRSQIIAQAPARTCPEFTDGVPAEKVPNDGRQYFAYDGCGDDNCTPQRDNSTGRLFINVEYRDPPLGKNGVRVYVSE